MGTFNFYLNLLSTCPLLGVRVDEKLPANQHMCTCLIGTALQKFSFARASTTSLKSAMNWRRGRTLASGPITGYVNFISPGTFRSLSAHYCIMQLGYGRNSSRFCIYPRLVEIEMASLPLVPNELRDKQRHRYILCVGCFAYVLHMQRKQ